MPDPSRKNFKIWKALKDAKAGFMVTPDEVLMVGNKKNMIACDKSGISISAGGSVSLNTTAENIRMGGLFVQMNDFVRMIPQTIVTPIPNCIPMPPMALPVSIAKNVAICAACLA